MKILGQKFISRLAAPGHSRRYAREKDCASLSGTSLSLKAKAPDVLEASTVSGGVSPIKKVSTHREGLGCTNEAHPADKRLAYSAPPRNTLLVNVLRIGSGNIVRVGSRHPFYPKKNGPLDVTRLQEQAPDETQQRANPGNGRVVDLAAAATPRFKGIPQGFLKLSLRFKSPSQYRAAVALSGRSTNAKRKPPLWGKL